MMMINHHDLHNDDEEKSTQEYDDEFEVSLTMSIRQ